MAWARARVLRPLQRVPRRLIQDVIPEKLRVGSFELFDIRREAPSLRTYSEYDPIDVPIPVMDRLSYFDGRPTAEALAIVAKERGVQLDPALVQKMVDFQLLVVPT